ncbi:hypothetical protein [Micromonospora sp. RTGN7]|uniref:hypothetical protein n=1 Tax=Micromonospora sp. RTGN7 TaxID=3016526 RepID=UPI0029FF1DBB|nr:hypothetical protein [Micromonospora sp. RTGN7]
MKFNVKLMLTVFVVGLAGSVLFQAVTAGWPTVDRALVAVTVLGGLLATLVGLAIYRSMRE